MIGMMYLITTIQVMLVLEFYVRVLSKYLLSPLNLFISIVMGKLSLKSNKRKNNLRFSKYL